MLQTAVVSMQQINSSTNISKKHVEEMSQVMNHISPSSLHIKQVRSPQVHSILSCSIHIPLARAQTITVFPDLLDLSTLS